MIDQRLRRIEGVRIFELAVQQLRSLILEGQYHEGERLPTEQQLVGLLGIGRSTVREALRVLEADGLIEVRRGSGAFVAHRSSWGTTRGEVLQWLAQRKEEVIHILQVRERVEGLTAYLAAERISGEQKAELGSIADEMEAKSANQTVDINALSDLDVRFHLAISEASGNRIANEIVSQLVPAFSEANRALLWIARPPARAAQEHRSVWLAIEARNPASAEQAMRDHIVAVQDAAFSVSEQESQ